MQILVKPCFIQYIYKISGIRNTEVAKGDFGEFLQYLVLMTSHVRVNCGLCYKVLIYR